MKKSKLISLLTALVLVLSLLSSTAFAAEDSAAFDPLTSPVPTINDIKPVDTTLTVSNEPQSTDVDIEPVVSPEPPIGKGGKDDPLRVSLKEKYVKLNELRAQDKSIQETLKAQTQANRALLQSIKTKLADTAKQFAAGYKEQITKGRAEIQTLRNQIKDLKTQLETAIKNKDKDAVTSLQAQIKDLSQQVKAKIDVLKALRDSYKAESARITELKNKVQQDLESVKVLWDKQKTDYSDIKTIRASKKAEWTTFGNAIKAKDLAAANSSMDKILSYKQQIYAEHNEISGLKTEVNQQLNAILASIQIA